MSPLHQLKSGLRRIAFFALGSHLVVGRRLRQLRGNGVRTVLNLHRVSAESRSAYESLDPALFDELLAFLQSEFRLTTFDEAADHPAGAARPAAIVSFDDGYKDFIEIAAPILRRRGIRCNHNLIPACIESGLPPLNVLAQDFVGQAPTALLKKLEVPGFQLDARDPRLGARLSAFLKNRAHGEQRALADTLLPQFRAWDGFRPTPMMDGADVRQIQDEHELGAHSYEHATMQFETNEYLAEDVRRCQAYFQDRFGIRVNIYAFPNGDCGPGQAEIVEAAGIEHVLLVGEKFDTQARRHHRFTFHARSRSEARFRAAGGLGKVAA